MQIIAYQRLILSIKDSTCKQQSEGRRRRAGLAGGVVERSRLRVPVVVVVLLGRGGVARKTPGGQMSWWRAGTGEDIFEAMKWRLTDNQKP